MAVDLPEYLKTGEQARLIPVAAVGQREQHAASIFLACLSIVRPYARDVLGTIGKRVGPQTRIQAYTEVVFRKQQPDNPCRPDGLLVLETSRSQWRALIESKIGGATIETDQLQRYAALAALNGIDAIITLSNELTPLPDQPPYEVPTGVAGRIEVFHWSWMKIVTMASLLLAGDEDIDFEQHYILQEMLRYFSHENIGVRGLHTMCPEWKTLVGKIHVGAKVQKNDIDVVSTVRCWHQEQQDICLMLARHLNAPISIRLRKTHRDSQAARTADDAERLADDKKLTASFDIPNLAGPIVVVADLVRRSVTCSMQVQAPEDRKRTSSKLNWLLRQLPAELDSSTVVHIHWRGGGTSYLRPSDLRATPDAPVELREGATAKAFEVAIVTDLERKFSGPKTFIDGLEAAVPRFYDEIARHIKAWQPMPPVGPASGSEDMSPDGLENVLSHRNPDRVVQRGEHNGRAFAIYEDGSIEIETAQGKKWFKDFVALRTFAERGQQARN